MSKEAIQPNRDEWVKDSVVERVRNSDSVFCSSGAYAAIETANGNIKVFSYLEKVE